MTTERLMLLAQMAAKRIEEERALMAAMTPEERDVYVKAWAKRIGGSMAAAGEYCPCCKSQAATKDGKATK